MRAVGHHFSLYHSSAALELLGHLGYFIKIQLYVLVSILKVQSVFDDWLTRISQASWKMSVLIFLSFLHFFPHKPDIIWLADFHGVLCVCVNVAKKLTIHNVLWQDANGLASDRWPLKASRDFFLDQLGPTEPELNPFPSPPSFFLSFFTTASFLAGPLSLGPTFKLRLILYRETCYALSWEAPAFSSEMKAGRPRGAAHPTAAAPRVALRSRSQVSL